MAFRAELVSTAVDDTDELCAVFYHDAFVIGCFTCSSDHSFGDIRWWLFLHCSFASGHRTCGRAQHDAQCGTLQTVYNGLHEAKLLHVALLKETGLAYHLSPEGCPMARVGRKAMGNMKPTKTKLTP